jgi:hypothetical protein
MTFPSADNAESARLAGLAARIGLAFIDGDEEQWLDLVNANLSETIDALNGYMIATVIALTGSLEAARAQLAEHAVRGEVESITDDS